MVRYVKSYFDIIISNQDLWHILGKKKKLNVLCDNL